jgi:hypothetical protein
MCLTGAAGIKPKRGLDYQIRTKAYKAGKWFLKVTGQNEKLEELQNRSGSEDYRNAKGVMRPTFVKVVNDDVTDILKDVKCSVLLVWGDQDNAALGIFFLYAPDKSAPFPFPAVSIQEHRIRNPPF